MYREVTMVELKEVLRLWGEGLPRKRLAAQLGLDPKTVRRYLRAAASTGWRPDGGAVTLFKKLPPYGAEQKLAWLEYLPFTLTNAAQLLREFDPQASTRAFESALRLAELLRPPMREWALCWNAAAWMRLDASAG